MAIQTGRTSLILASLTLLGGVLLASPSHAVVPGDLGIPPDPFGDRGGDAGRIFLPTPVPTPFPGSPTPGPFVPGMPTPTPSPGAPFPTPYPGAPGTCPDVLKPKVLVDPNAFNPAIFPSAPYAQFWKETETTKRLKSWREDPLSFVLGMNPLPLLGKSVRLAWALELDSNRIHYIDGTILELDNGKGAFVLEYSTGGKKEKINIPIASTNGETLYIYFKQEDLLDKNTPIPAEIVGADRDAMIESGGEIIMTPVVQSAEEMEVAWDSRMTRVESDFSEKATFADLEASIAKMMKFTGRTERASLMADAAFVNLVTTEIRYGFGQSGAQKTSELFENFEMAYALIQNFSKDLVEVQTKLAKSPDDAVFQKHRDFLQGEIDKANTVIAENIVRYTWTRRALRAMANGKGDCLGGCAERSRAILDDLGVSARVQLRYPNRLQGVSRPSIQEVQNFFEKRKDLILARLEYEKGLQIRATLMAMTIIPSLFEAADKVVGMIPIETARVWIRKVFSVVAEVRIRREHLPRLNMIRFGMDNMVADDKLAENQEIQLKAYAAVDPEILVTAARMAEATPMWRNVRDYATRYDAPFLEDMKKAESEGSRLGRISSIQKPSILSRVGTGLLVGGAIYGAYVTGLGHYALQQLQIVYHLIH